MRFSGQTVLITGGTGGMGSSHARAYHAEGANVIIGVRTSADDPNRSSVRTSTDDPIRSGVPSRAGDPIRSGVRSGADDPIRTGVRSGADDSVRSEQQRRLGRNGALPGVPLDLAAELGERAMAVRLDVTSEADWAGAVSAAEQRFGSVTILVNNAGVQNPPATVESTDRQTWDRTLATNVTGQFLGIRAVTPSMRRAGGGVIVNIGSTMAYGGTAMYAPYVAAKWAIRGLTSSAALELARDGIRVNALHPGVVDTRLISEPAGPGARPIADFYDPSPFAVPRLGTPTDITEALLYLTSPAAAFMTGTDLIIDGGLLLGPALPAAA